MHVLKSRFVHIRYECLFGEMCERETKLRSLSFEERSIMHSGQISFGIFLRVIVVD